MGRKDGVAVRAGIYLSWCDILLVSVATITTLVGSDIYGFYQRWLLLWTA